VEQDFVNLPAARSWREIPQPVKPRAMSRGGRWRRVLAVLRVAAVGAFVGGVAWGGWMIVSALRQNSSRMPALAKTVPVRPPELRTTRDGVLDDAWLARTLALPRGASLMELNLEQLRARLLANGQVLTATLTRQFPDRLIVHVTERAPVARMRVEQAGMPRDLLVARDGVVFAGSGFDPAMLETLPWLGGVALATEAGRIRPIAHMDVVAQFLADAQLVAEHHYQTWEVVSLARLESDDEIEVTTRTNSMIVFSAKGGFFVQLAKLDYMLEQLARLSPAPVRIDLSLGREVAVRPIGVGFDAPTKPAQTTAVRPFFRPLPVSQSQF
jgi:hypothetical protein